jgi:hypothetical protein
VCVKLCIKANDDDLTARAERLSKEYLTTEHTATLSGRLHKARREPTETALKFLTRMAPLGRAVALMGVLQERAVLAALWRKETLGKPCFQANSTYFEPIKSKVLDGKIAEIDQLLKAAEGYADMEAVPAVAAAPVTVPKERNSVGAHIARSESTRPTRAGRCTLRSDRAISPPTPKAETSAMRRRAMKLLLQSAWRCRWDGTYLW